MRCILFYTVYTGVRAIASALLHPSRNLISFNSAISACEKAGRWQEVLCLLQDLAGVAGGTGITWQDATDGGHQGHIKPTSYDWFKH